MNPTQVPNSFTELNLADEKIKIEVNDLKLYYGE